MLLEVSLIEEYEPILWLEDPVLESVDVILVELSVLPPSRCIWRNILRPMMSASIMEPITEITLKFTMVKVILPQY